MISFDNFLFSAFLAALLYVIIWKVMIFFFRTSVYKLLYYSIWIRIDEEVKKIVLRSRDGKFYEVFSIDYKNERIELEVDDITMLEILDNDWLFDSNVINDSWCEFFPNIYFSQVSQELKRKIVKKSKKLHERFDGYPLLIRLELDGANKVLDIIDSYIK